MLEFLSHIFETIQDFIWSGQRTSEVDAHGHLLQASQVTEKKAGAFISTKNTLHALARMPVFAAVTLRPRGSWSTPADPCDRVTGDWQRAMGVTLTFLAGASRATWAAGIARGTPFAVLALITPRASGAAVIIQTFQDTGGAEIVAGRNQRASTLLTVIWQSLDNAIVSRSTLFTEVTGSVMLTILAYGGFRVTQAAVSMTLTRNTGAQGWSRGQATRLRTQSIKSWHACLTRQARIAWRTITSFYQVRWRGHCCDASLFSYLH